MPIAARAYPAISFASSIVIMCPFPRVSMRGPVVSLYCAAHELL
jgi:hypothetical protein